MENRPKKLLEQARDALQLKQYSYGTEESYGYRVKRFILFNHQRRRGSPPDAKRPPFAWRASGALRRIRRGGRCVRRI